MQEITVAEALAAWEQAGQTVEINDGRCQWSREGRDPWEEKRCPNAAGPLRP